MTAVFIQTSTCLHADCFSDSKDKEGEVLSVKSNEINDGIARLQQIYGSMHISC